MARAARVDLRSFQQELAERLAARTSAHVQASRLAFCTGEDRWLVRLADTGEVLTAPAITPVPLTRPWYLGIANIRGNLFSIIDFAAYLGRAPARISSQARVLLLGSRQGELRAGLLVDRVVGLRSLDKFDSIDGRGESPVWHIQLWRDEAGQDWQEIDLGRFARETAFLQVGR